MASGEITLKTEQEIELIRESSLLVSQTLAEVGRWVEPGVSTLKLDQVAEAFIRAHGGIPAFKHYKPGFAKTPFPFSLCISINEEVVHGLASPTRILKEGDIVSVDCGVQKNGYFGDSAYTFAVGQVAPRTRKLMEVTKTALQKGIEKMVAGNKIGEVAYAVQQHVEAHGFSVVREMVGHGVGKALHEAPDVPNHGRRSSGVTLQEGMVLAIEPMINQGRRFIRLAKDGWTVFATDHLPSAHYEHTVVVRKGQAEVLTTFELIEKVTETQLG